LAPDLSPSSWTDVQLPRCSILETFRPRRSVETTLPSAEGLARTFTSRRTRAECRTATSGSVAGAGVAVAESSAIGPRPPVTDAMFDCQLCGRKGSMLG